MSEKVKTIALVTVLFLIATIFSACAQSVPLSDRAIVKAIYFNEDKENNITASIVMYTCKPGANTAEVQGDPVIYTGYGESVSQALKDAEAQQNKQPFYEQNKILLLGTGTFDGVSQYLTYFGAQSMNMADLNVFLTRISAEDFKNLGTSSTDIIKAAEGIANAGKLEGNKARQIYEMNISKEKEFSGYLPVLEAENAVATDISELMVFAKETPLFSLSEIPMDLTLILSKEMQKLNISLPINGVETDVETQKLSVTHETFDDGTICVKISGTVKNMVQNGENLTSLKQDEALKELNAQLEEIAITIINLTTMSDNDIFNLNDIMYSKENKFCESVCIKSNLTKST